MENGRYEVRISDHGSGNRGAEEDPRRHVPVEDRDGAGDHRREAADGRFPYRVEGGRGNDRHAGQEGCRRTAPRQTPQRLAKLAAEIAKAAPRNILDDLRQQNRELLR